MRVTHQLRQHLRLQSALFLALFTALVAGLMWLSARYPLQSDWTQNASNTLATVSQQMLTQVTQPTTLKAFVGASNRELREHIQALADSFSRVNPKVTLEFIDPVKEPAAVRQYEVSVEGEVIVTQENRSTQLAQLSEQELVNALIRVSRTQQRRITFVAGHKERGYNGQNELDYTALSSELRKKGYVVDSVNLAVRKNISADTSLLIIADPRSAYLPGEIGAIEDYLQRGGNLLWLFEPLTALRLDSLAEDLGVDPLAGIVIDPTTELMGINDRRFTLVAEYPFHPITQGFTAITVFPTSRAFLLAENDVWQPEVFLETQQQAWAESDDSNSDYAMDSSQDVGGPLVIGASFTRIVDELDRDASSLENDFSKSGEPGSALDEGELAESIEEKPPDAAPTQQRVVVIGDADFLADAYLGQVGNSLLANNIFDYLVGEQTFIDLPNRVAVDSTIAIGPAQLGFIGSVFIVVLPGLLAGAGAMVWYKRRKR